MRIVYATATCSATTPDGLTVRLNEGEPWDADDPFVKHRPDCFSDIPPGPQFPRRTVRTAEHRVVEQATAAPGEHRNVRRRG